MFDDLRGRVPHLPRKVRLGLAALCLLLAGVSLLGNRHPARPVVVAVHPVAAGHLLTTADLAVRHPGGAAVAGAPTTIRAAVGRRLASPLATGEPVTPTRLLGRDLTTGLPAGSVAVPLPIDNPRVAELVHPGDRVDVLAGPGGDGLAATDGAPVGSARVLLSGVRVLAVFGSTGSAADDTMAEVVVVTDRDGSLRVVDQGANDSVTVVATAP